MEDLTLKKVYYGLRSAISELSDVTKLSNELVAKMELKDFDQKVVVHKDIEHSPIENPDIVDIYFNLLKELRYEINVMNDNLSKVNKMIE